MYGWMIQTPKGDFLPKTFSKTEEGCWHEALNSTGEEPDNPFEWARKQREQGYSPVEIMIDRPAKHLERK